MQDLAKDLRVVKLNSRVRHSYEQSVIAFDFE